jgi:hypothetical protein
MELQQHLLLEKPGQEKKMAKRKLIYILDEDVCGFITFMDDFPQNVKLAENLTNNPTVIKVDNDVDVMRTWKYDGENFYDPNE